MKSYLSFPAWSAPRHPGLRDFAWWAMACLAGLAGRAGLAAEAQGQFLLSPSRLLISSCMALWANESRRTWSTG